MFIQLRDTPCSSALAGFTRFGLQLPASKKQNTPCPSCVGGVRELRCRKHENVHTCVSGRPSRSLSYYGDTLPSPCRLFIREWPPPAQESSITKTKGCGRGKSTLLHCCAGHGDVGKEAHAVSRRDAMHTADQGRQNLCGRASHLPRGAYVAGVS